VRSVRRSADWDRIIALPVTRPHTPLPNLDTADPRPLRDVQTLSLEACARGGAFLPVAVGGGKTLITLLAPQVMRANRPVLLLPASLIEKTERDRQAYAKHWQVAKHLRYISYEALGRVRMATELETYRPDLIIADECHRLKNLRAACTRRVARYMEDHPETKFVGLSGTVMRHSIKDFAHLLVWSLKDQAPVPLDRDELEEWAQCLDDDDPMARMAPGPLGRTVEEARAGFQKRLTSHPGIVIHQSEDTAASLRIQALEYKVNETTEQAFKTLRAEWATPTGYTFSEAIMLWKFARELALGHWVEWDPHAPAEWLDARRDWAVRVREVLSRSRTLDSELHVRLAVQVGETHGKEILEAWEKLKGAFTPNPHDTWQDQGALEACQAWAAHDPGIIFTGHSFFGRTLAKRLAVPYYGAKGKNDQGQPIEAEKGDRVVVASIQANGTGRNLQAFSRALVTASQTDLEQLLGRLHRQGQEADEVTFDFLVGCWEHVDGFWKAFENADKQHSLTGGTYKLSYADITMPTREDIKTRAGARWTNQGTKT
jgi:hypothetical protein